MCKTRKTPALCLALLSFLVFVCGVIMIVMIVGMSTYDQAASSSIETPEIKMTSDVGSGLLWVCSIMSMIVAIAGCIAVKIKHRCYIICYGFCLGGIWLGIFIIGCIFAFAATSVPVIGEALCSPMNATAPNNSYNQGGLDRDLMQVINGQMCTPVCPCPVAAKAVYDA